MSSNGALQVDRISGAPELQFRTIYEAEFAYVHRSLRRLGVRTADLEDVAHDVFVVVHRRLPDFETDRPIRPWLFGIAFRVASDHRKLARHVREVGGEVDAACPLPWPDAQLAAAQARDLVLEALTALDLDRRAVFVMHDVDGHSVPDISAALDVPLNTVYSRLRLAREKFAAAVHRIRARGGEGAKP